MAKFHIVFADGKEETVEQNDCTTVEQLISCRFGTCDTSKVKVALADEPVEAKPVKHAKK